MMIRYFLACFLLSFGTLLAQELDATVRVNYETIQSQDKRLFREMEEEFQQFLNNNKWTNDTYGPKERITCNFSINLTESPATGQYKATVQVQSVRPVYGSGYETPLLNFADRDWNFDYVESQPMNFNPNSYSNEITSLLAFYAYIVIGYDYDSFSELGGAPHFDRAQQVAQTAASSTTSEGGGGGGGGGGPVQWHFGAQPLQPDAGHDQSSDGTHPTG